jgi:hypothetical protein
MEQNTGKMSPLGLFRWGVALGLDQHCIADAHPVKQIARVSPADPFQSPMFWRIKVRSQAESRHSPRPRVTYAVPELSRFRLMDVQGRVVRGIVP